MSLIKRLALYLLIASISINVAKGQINEADSIALIRLFEATDGYNWNTNTYWLSNKPVSDWYGINVVDGRITEIRLSSNNLTGILPDEMSELTNLNLLNVYDNNLTGKIPDLSSLTQLQTCDLRYNYLQGGLNSFVSHSSLIYFYINENQFSFYDLIIAYNAMVSKLGSWSSSYYANQRKLGEEMHYPYAVGVSYSFTLGDYVPHQNDIIQWYKNGIAITGATNDSLVVSDVTEDEQGFYNCIITNIDLPNVTLESNLMSIGKIFIEQQERNALIEFYNSLNGSSWNYKNNWLTDRSLDEWYGVTIEYGRISKLYLPSNNLQGEIPPSVNDLKGLKELYLNNNQISGSLPDMSAMSALEIVRINDNKISGGLSSLTGNSKLTDIYVYKNHFDYSDLLPVFLQQKAQWNWSNYNWRYADQILGDPEEFSYTLGKNYTFSTTEYTAHMNDSLQWYKNGIHITGANSSTLEISSAKEEDIGVYHMVVFNSMAQDSGMYVEIKSNFFSIGGDLIATQERDALVALYNSTDGGNWTRNDNWLSDKPLEDWYGVVVENNRVYQISLQNNNLNGILPAEIGNLKGLNYLNLSENQLEGALPDLSDLVSLSNLDLSDNQLNSGLSSVIELTNLQYLDVSYNSFGFGDIIPAKATDRWNWYYSAYYSPQVYGIEADFEFVVGNNYQFTAGSYVAHVDDSIQWYHEGRAISGANDATLTISNASKTDIGNYSLIVFNSNLPSLNIENPKMVIGADQIGPIERQILVDFYNATGGGAWSYNTNWLSDEPIENWFGVYTENGRITRISLSNNNLVGTIPADLSSLVFLQRFEVSDNQLEGDLPDFSYCNNLQYLSIQNNELTGGLNHLVELQNLSSVYISNNQFSFADIVPLYDTLSQRIYWYSSSYSPQYLGVQTDYPYVSGSTYNLMITGYENYNGDSIQWYKNEVAISSANNQTYSISNASSDDIATYYYKIFNPAMSYLELIGKPLTIGGESIEQKERNALVALYDATGGDNWYNKNNWKSSAPLSDWYGVEIVNGRVSALDLASNNLMGTLPDEIADLDLISYIELQYNNLKGEIPDLSGLKMLTSAYLFSNYFSSGIIPISDLPKLKYFYVYNNKFDFSELTPAFQNMKNNLGYTLYCNPQRLLGDAQIHEYVNNKTYQLSYADVNLHTNDSVQWFKDGTAITEANNAILTISNAQPGDTGVYHMEIYSDVITNLTLSTSAIHIVGSERYEVFEVLSAFYNSTNGDMWYSKGNWFTDEPLNNWYGISTSNGKITQINLSYNNLTGSLPSELSNLSSLQYLQVHGNQLTGEIPASYKNFTNLITLYVYSNKLSGNIPDFSSSSVLRNVRIHDNNFTGGLNYLANLPNLDYYYFYVYGNLFPMSELSSAYSTLVDTKGLYWYSSRYNPQKKFGTEQDLEYVEGNNYVLNSSGYVASAGDQLQWYKDGAIVNGANSSTLFISNAVIGDMGFYQLKVSNPNVPDAIWESNTIAIGGEQIEELERQALIALYNSTNGNTWNYRYNWLTSASLDDWYGITVENGRVSKISLPYNNLTGELPSEIGNLQGLTELYLYSNAISGVLPNEIGDIPSLTYLSLNGNELSGAIPSWPNSNLSSVYLNNNNLSSGLSNLFNLKNLSYGNNIQVSNNRFNFIELISAITKLTGRSLYWSSYYYSPQQNLGVLTDYSFVEGSNYTFDLEGYSAHTDDKFQWYKDGNVITGQTSASLSILNATTDDIGFYHCVVSNQNLTSITLNSYPMSIGGNEIKTLEREALIALYNSTNGINWHNRNNWISDAPLEDWYGITVTNGRVTQISLSSNNLTGTLPVELGNLKAVTYLNFSNNEIQGAIPEMFDLTELYECYLYNNNLTSGLSSIARIPDYNPYYFYVYGNKFQFDEIVPAYDTLVVQNGNYWYYGRYRDQQKLGTEQDLVYVEGQKYTFTLDDYRPNVNDEVQWYKDGDPITGANSTTLILNNANSASRGYYVCKITNSHVPDVTLESYPISIGGSEIEVLEREALIALYQSTQGGGWTSSYNWLSDNPIDDWYGVVVTNGRVTSLNLDNNNLDGPLPEELNNLNALDYLYLYNNNITGTIPDVSGLKILRYAYLYQNMISGGIEKIAALDNIETLDVDNNVLTFTSLIPAYNAMIENNGNWSYYNYSPQKNLGEAVEYDFVMGNNYTFNVGSIDFHEADQIQWYKDGHILEGENGSTLIIENAQSSDRGFYYFTITNEMMSTLTLESELMSIGGDEIESLEKEALIALFNSTGGLNWNSRSYWMSNRPLNDWYGITVSHGRVTKISLTYNNLDGILPEELNNLTALQELYLYNNNLSGIIPDVSSLTNLTKVYLYQNNLVGGLASIACLPNLTVLDVDNNLFTYTELVPAKDSLASHNITWSYYNYYPQKNVGESKKFIYEEGRNYVFAADDYKAHPNDTYQWYKDGYSISGATSAQYIISSAQSTDRATYTYRVLNPGFSGMQLISNNIELTGLSGVEIVNFTIPGQVGDSEIDQQKFTVRITMPFGTALNSLTPAITLPSGSTAVPSNGQSINFTLPVIYTVTSSTGSFQKWTITVINEHEGARCAEPIAYGQINSPKQSGNLIQGKYYWYEFTLPETFKLVDINTNGSTLDTKIALFESCPDVSTDINNLSGALVYDDDSGDGRASRIYLDSLEAGTYKVVIYSYWNYFGDYNISITGIPPNASHETNILAVNIPHANKVEVNSQESTVLIYLPYATDVSSIIPDISLSAGARVSPENNIAQSFINPIIYTVTAEDGYTTQPWTFSVYKEQGQQERNLDEGWNWISFNLENEDMSVENMLTSVDPIEADYLKSNLASSRYYDGLGWFGDLDVVDNKKMYMAYISNSDNLQINGGMVNPVHSNIPIDKGWNWIAYTPNVSYSINETFTGFDFVTNDYVKGQDKSAVYFEGFGWLGELSTMNPLYGYMFNSSTNGSLNYAVPSTKSSIIELDDNPVSALDEKYQFNRSEFEYSASIISIVADPSGKNVVSENDILLIFDQQRKILGVSKAIYIPPFNRYQFIAMAYSNENNQEVSFELIKANNQQVYEIANIVSYQPNEILGSGTEPIVLNTSALVNVNALRNNFSVYPNPASNKIWVVAPDRITQLSLFNTEGKMVLNRNAKNVENNHYQLQLNDLPNGIYYLRIYTEHEVKVEKVVLR